MTRKHPFHSSITFHLSATMQFSKAALSLFLLARSSSAFTCAGKIPRHGLAPLRAVSTDTFATESLGEEKTDSFRVQFKDGSDAISPWHDIPLSNDDGSYNMVSGLRDGKPYCFRRFSALEVACRFTWLTLFLLHTRLLRFPR